MLILKKERRNVLRVIGKVELYVLKKRKDKYNLSKSLLFNKAS